jgi:hypothetical protein
MAAILATTYLHNATNTSISLAYLRIAFRRKRLHAAPYSRQEKWRRFSLQLTFTSPPSQVFWAYLRIVFSQQTPSRCSLFL